VATSSPQNLTTWQIIRLVRHLPNFLRLYWQLFTDSRVPLRAKGILIAAILYILNPFDFLPDFLFPFWGMADDLGVIFVAARWFISLCPPDVVQERVREISGT
jgi:uncharacterized membrane protein YkvA (DUF1232 family)